MNENLRPSPLHVLHCKYRATMGEFAGHLLPIQYPGGIAAEHRHTRAKASLFDVSHMGQFILRPRRGHLSDVAQALEKTCPIDLLSLKPGRQRYGFFTNLDGGICDDWMIAHRGDRFLLVVNASQAANDLDLLAEALGDDILVEAMTHQALLALQGPDSEAVLTPYCPKIAAMRFLDVKALRISGIEVTLARSGYTGEDGFEISVHAKDAIALAQLLLTDTRVHPAGLGARDSLRLEAGLCLYGNDIDTAHTPVESDLLWAIQKARHEGGRRAGGYPGANIIEHQIKNGVQQRRVGMIVEGRAPVRAGALLYTDPEGTNRVGAISSGSFGPSINAPIAMGYVETAFSSTDTRLYAGLRGRFVPLRIQKLPFLPPRYKR